MGVKKRKKTISKKTFLLIIFLGIILLVLCLLRFVPVMFGYKIDSRVDTLKQYKEQHSNLEVVGWLKVQGTDIDYPILEGVNQIEYEEGKIQYVWENGTLDFSNRINYIIGHNIMNLSTNPLIAEKGHVRFEQLLSFTYPEFIEKNKYIQLTIGKEEYLYKIFSVSYIPSATILPYNNAYQTDRIVNEYLKNSREQSIYDFDVSVDSTDKFLSLLTCTRMFGSIHTRDFVVDARLLRKGEDTGNYKVVKNKNYDEVDLKMKGENGKDEEV